MSKYSIKELSQLSGVKAHTIRIWEKRYQVVMPERTPTNIRYYSDNDLKKLLNVAILNSRGFKISYIASLSERELMAKVNEMSKEQTDYDLHIDQMAISMIDFDEYKFEKLINKFIKSYGFETTIIKIVYPFLNKVGILWLSNNITPIQEHFITNLIRQKIIAATDRIPISQNKSAKKVLLFLPPKELHELGLLYCNYILKKTGFKTIYLGQQVPLADLETAATKVKPDYFISIFSGVYAEKTIVEFSTRFTDKFPTSHFFFSGKPLLQLRPKLPKKVRLFNSMKELRKIFSEIDPS
ncbi:MerR family transcriptional regulator [Fulvivirga maritima]|uniref:MerR family transcriptional regulator n=1 Tax=Fulvivirga maritima TaxID=2904247 RepID=UPI001F315308|nr:MerR family transcriptional regulator [Fulvivirga maritima]UII26579.1 MerR family transcriptional regulator [Fulvivirga maritima]